MPYIFFLNLCLITSVLRHLFTTIYGAQNDDLSSTRWAKPSYVCVYEPTNRRGRSGNAKRNVWGSLLLSKCARNWVWKLANHHQADALKYLWILAFSGLFFAVILATTVAPFEFKQKTKWIPACAGMPVAVWFAFDLHFPTTSRVAQFCRVGFNPTSSNFQGEWRVGSSTHLT